MCGNFDWNFTLKVINVDRCLFTHSKDLLQRFYVYIFYICSYHILNIG